MNARNLLNNFLFRDRRNGDSRGAGMGSGRMRGMGRGRGMGKGMGRRKLGTSWGMNMNGMPVREAAKPQIIDTYPASADITQQKNIPVKQENEINSLKAQARIIEEQLRNINDRIRNIDRDDVEIVQIPVVDSDKCIACYACEAACPTGAITINEKAVVDPAKCSGCGQCINVCPQEALSSADV